MRGFSGLIVFRITFEEVEKNVSTRTSGEKTSAGIQMGNASVVSGQIIKIYEVDRH